VRDLRQTFRLIATLLFGLLVLALLFVSSAQMAAHQLQRVAERAVRQVFAEGRPAQDGVEYQTVCRGPGRGGPRASECDPVEVKAERSLRSVSCGGGGFLRFVGRQWDCAARFGDGATLRVRVSVGFGDRHVELVLPFHEAGSEDAVTRRDTGLRERERLHETR